jgi:hypothetical protein
MGKEAERSLTVAARMGRAGALSVEQVAEWGRRSLTVAARIGEAGRVGAISVEQAAEWRRRSLAVAAWIGEGGRTGALVERRERALTIAARIGSAES